MDSSESIRINKFLSEAGFCSRRQADKLIESKRVKINDLIPEVGTKVKPTDEVKVDNKIISHSKKEKILLLTDYQVFGKPYRTKLPEEKKYKKSKSKAFASIKRGDYVVHENYGIGKYSGLETIKIGESKQESMKLLYNDGGVVYVNLNYLNLVKRYSSN